MNVNKVIIVGRATADPQLRQTPGGQPVTSFGVATNRTWTNKAGAKQEEVEFHNIVAWGRTAEVASQYLTKGALVFIEGRLQTRSWTDKQNQQRKTTDIVCERLQLGPKPGGSGGYSPSQNISAGKAEQTLASPSEANSVKPPQSDSGQAVEEEIPIIDIDEGEIKPEDLPF